MSYLAIGNCSKYNLYILVSLICNFMIDLLFGLNSSNKDKPVRFFSFKAKIKNHKLLYNFINFASIFFGGVILYFLERKNQKTIKNQLSIETYEKMKNDLLKTKDESNLLNLILIGIFFPLTVTIHDFINSQNNNVGFWALEILYICIFSYFIFNAKYIK